MNECFLYNAHCVGLGKALPFPTAVQLQGGNVVAMGQDEELLRLRKAGSQAFDLHGAWLYLSFFQGSMPIFPPSFGVQTALCPLSGLRDAHVDKPILLLPGRDGPVFTCDCARVLQSIPIPRFGSSASFPLKDLQDAGDAVIDCTETDPRIRFAASYLKQGLAGASDRCRMRRGVFLRLQAALTLLGEGYGFLVFDVLRPIAVQKALFDAQLAVVRARQPELAPAQAAELAGEFVAPPIFDPARGSTHLSGGAVDLTLTCDGQPLSMGTEFDDFRENAHSDFYERETLGEGEIIIRNNRRLLHGALRAAGFTNYESEWWHYDFGDHNWAAATGNAPIYGFYDDKELDPNG